MKLKIGAESLVRGSGGCLCGEAKHAMHVSMIATLSVIPYYRFERGFIHQTRSEEYNLYEFNPLFGMLSGVIMHGVIVQHIFWAFPMAA